ncbi:undecaprenyl-diphosphatase [Bacillus salipaludis]|uniref:Undecaprenyl-diphosphatase n=1 Tax=Bacillus salipaludis TaxID=2547811 RepID=A0ABW8RNY2_9BACI
MLVVYALRPYLNPMMIFIAEYAVFFLAIAVMVIWFTRNSKNRMMVLCGASFVLSEILGKIAGKIHSNNQPFAELANVNKLIDKAVDNSFPSDHTILFFSFCITIWMFKRGWGFLWIVLASLVGVARIWVGVHFPGDVIVGAIISIITASIVYQVVPRLSITHKLLGIYEKSEQFLITSVLKPKETKSKDI